MPRKKPRVLVVFSPNAGLATKQDVKKIIDSKLREFGYTREWLVLNKNYERKLASRNLYEFELVLAVGGDGTVKVSARTILENQLDIPLAIIPFGSANVVAAEMGIPFKLEPALKVLSKKKKTKIDVGLINRRYYFLVGFSVGYVSEIVTGTSTGLKKSLGFLGYLLSLIFNKIKIRKYKFKIETANRTFWIKGNSLIIFNMVNYFGLKPKKLIKYDDGLLNMYILTNKTYFALIIAFLYSMFYKKAKKFIFDFDSSYFKIKLRLKSHTCQIDGDYIDLPKTIEVKTMRNKLTVISNL